MASTQANSPSLCIAETKSLCPVCLARIDACYTTQYDTVVLTKTCPEHGTFETPVWEGVAPFRAWQGQQTPAQAPVNPARKTERGCPYDCGLCEAHRQASCCVLLELTKRCNLHCPVCFAQAGGSEGVDPSLETIARWYDRILDSGGPFNIQLSGGEPTLRDDLPQIIHIGKERGFSFFQLNTNGLRIARELDYLQALANAGLNTVFLQFDSLSAEACVALRGRNIIEEKKQAVQNCAAAGLGVVLTPTLQRGVNDGEIGALIDFAAAALPTVRGVHFQPLSFFGRYTGDPVRERITLSTVLTLIEAQSGGRLAVADFRPSGAEHPLCSFQAKYRVHGGIWELRKSAGKQGCCCAPSSDTARRTVARQWSAVKPPPPPKALPGFKLDSLDMFVDRAVQQERETIEISGMAFQDAWTVDLARLSRCYINIVSPEGLLMPFCAYNLTAANGKPLHRAI